MIEEGVGEGEGMGGVVRVLLDNSPECRAPLWYVNIDYAQSIPMTNSAN